MFLRDLFSLVLKSNGFTYAVMKYSKSYIHWYISFQIYQNNLLPISFSYLFHISLSLSGSEFPEHATISQPLSKIQARLRADNIKHAGDFSCGS